VILLFINCFFPYSDLLNEVKEFAKEITNEEPFNKQSRLVNYLMEMKIKSDFVSVTFSISFNSFFRSIWDLTQKIHFFLQYFSYVKNKSA
jgi:hypothetical protein